MLADRFGGTPFTYWRVGAQDRERLLELLAVEAEVSEAFRGLGPGDDVVYAADDDED